MTSQPGSARTVRFAAVAAVTAAVTLTAACSGSSGSASSNAPKPAVHHATPSGTVTPSSGGGSVKSPRNPLTDVGPVPKTPVIVVKIDDTAPGRPQVGIDKADVVYIEAVEAGLTRLAAVFGTNKPSHVGYVRSTRPSDPELLRQYGKITEAFSGGQDVSRNIAKRAGLNLWSFGAGKKYYYRVDRPESTYINVILDLAALAKHAKTNRPHSIGWHFSTSLTGIGSTPGPKVETVVTGSYSTGTPVEFRWNATAHRYIRYIDGVEQHAADGKPVSAVNVIVQSCRVTTFSADRDVNGSPAQYTHSVGTGAVSVFRQGRRINGTWSRAKATAGTTLRTVNGKTLPLAPGNTWVVLIRKGVPVSS